MFAELLDQVDDCVAEGRYDEAIRFVRKAIRKEGRTHVLLYNLAYAYLNKGWDYWKIGEFAYDKGDIARAIRYAREALRLKPRCPLSRLLFADALVRARKDREARVIYNGIVRQGVPALAGGICGEGVCAARTYLADALYGIADSYYLGDDLEKSVSAFETCVTFIRENRVRNTRRSLRDIKRELREARVRMAKSKHPTVADLMEEKRYDEALREVIKDIRENGNSHYALANLSEIYLSKGRNLSALKAAREAERITKRCPLVRLALGKALAATGNTDEAVGVFKGIINQDLRSLANGECGEGLRSARTFKAEALLGVARAVRKAGMSAESLSWYRRCVLYRRKNNRKMMRCVIPAIALREEMKSLESEMLAR